MTAAGEAGGGAAGHPAARLSARGPGEDLDRLIDPQTLLARARLALRLGEWEHALATCLHLLRHLPGYLEARALAAQAYLEGGQNARAARELEAVVRLDPESQEAQAGLGVLARRLGNRQQALRRLSVAWELDPSREEASAALARLRTELGLQPQLPPPGPAALGRLYLLAGKPLEALPLLERALRGEPQRMELRLSRAEALWRTGEPARALAACREILKAAPQTLKAKLLASHLLLQEGLAVEGSRLLHEARGQDASGQLAAELGLDLLRPPEPPALPSPGDLPRLTPELAQALQAARPETESRRDPRRALAHLSGGREPAPGGRRRVDPELAQVEVELQRIAERLFSGQRSALPKGANGPRVGSPAAARWRPAGAGPGEDGQRPTELILASRRVLVERYGAEGFARIDARLQQLKQAAEEGSRLSVALVYLDDPAATRLHGLEPVGRSPEEIKAFVAAFRERLERAGQQMRYLLLVGGPACLPFYPLPNPVEDYDEELLSDNPYGEDGEEFLVPGLAVGRLPDGEGEGPGTLLRLLETAIRRHRWPYGPPQPSAGLGFFLRWLELLGGYRPSQRSSGYSALVWQESSRDVYRVVSRSQGLHTSPPRTDSDFFSGYLDGVRVAYFNLHGTEDSPAWYGQKDHTYPDEYPLFPVAITPETVAAADLSSAIVFSEACYGANIVHKRVRESMALSFLAAGSPGFFGSTKIAYGAPQPPLQAADLLGRYLLQALAEGLPLGEALVQAKSMYARELLQRQGYLDAEDQKTLLGFVLYGDPALRVSTAPAYLKSVPVGVTLGGYCPPLICRWEAREVESPPMELVARVRKAIQERDPSLAAGRLSVEARTFCHGGHPGALVSKERARVPGCECEPGEAPEGGQLHRPRSQGYVFSSRETVVSGRARIRRVARVTTDERGRILKMVLSR